MPQINEEKKKVLLNERQTNFKMQYFFAEINVEYALF